MAMKIESIPASMTTDVEFRGLAGEIQQIFLSKSKHQKLQVTMVLLLQVSEVSHLQIPCLQFSSWTIIN